jgi:hypothetical protein
VEQNLETKSECGDLRKTKEKDSTKVQFKKPKDDLPCKNSPLPKDPATSKSACKSNNLIKKPDPPIKTMDSLEISKPKRKESIMSFGDEKRSLGKDSTPSLQDLTMKDIRLKRKNSLDQVHQ